MTTFKPSYRGLGELLRGGEMQAEMRRRVDRAKDVAEAIAPVGPEGDPHRGEYKASFETHVDVEETASGSRAVGRLVNTAGHAVDVEYGGGGRSAAPTDAAHFTMTRAMDGMRD